MIALTLLRLLVLVIFAILSAFLLSKYIWPRYKSNLKEKWQEYELFKYQQISNFPIHSIPSVTINGNNYTVNYILKNPKSKLEIYEAKIITNKGKKLNVSLHVSFNKGNKDYPITLNYLYTSKSSPTSGIIKTIKPENIKYIHKSFFENYQGDFIAYNSILESQK